MTIGILGAGALGCFFAAKLSQKYDVLLIGRDEGKIKRVRENGITVKGLSRFKAVKKNLAAVTETKKIAPVDLLLVLVKAHQTEEAVKQHRHLAGGNTVILTLQNGLGNVEAIKQGTGNRGQGAGGGKALRHKGAEKAHSPFPMIYAGITAHGVTQHSPGVVKHAGRGETVIEQGAGNRVQGTGEEEGQRYKGSKAHSPSSPNRKPLKYRGQVLHCHSLHSFSALAHYSTFAPLLKISCQCGML